MKRELTGRYRELQAVLGRRGGKACTPAQQAQRRATLQRINEARQLRRLNAPPPGSGA